MVKRTHRVEYMREHPRARLDAGHRLLIGCIGMSDRNGDATLGQHANRVERPFEFRCERYQLEGLELEHPFERLALRQEIQRRMYTQPPRRDERTFEMHSENRRADEGAATRAPLLLRLRGHRLGDDRVAALDLIERRRDYRREPSGRALMRKAM